MATACDITKQKKEFNDNIKTKVFTQVAEKLGVLTNAFGITRKGLELYYSDKNVAWIVNGAWSTWTGEALSKWYEKIQKLGSWANIANSDIYKNVIKEAKDKINNTYIRNYARELQWQ